MCIDKKLFIIANKQLKYQLTDEWVNKIYNNGLWFSHKGEWSTDIHYNIHVPWNTRYHWKYYAKWRSSRKRPHFVWFLLKKMFRKGKIIATKSWLTVKLEVRMMTANGHQDTFWGDRDVLRLDCCDGFTMPYIFWTTTVLINSKYFLNACIYS